MRYSCIWYVLCFCACFYQSKAQSPVIDTDSTYDMPAVTVEGASPLRASMETTIDSSALLLDNAIGIGGLLKYHSLIYIKDYGPGNMTTVSARGGSASQSQVFWNGININQAGLGLTDLSTLPPFLLDRITVQQSASGALSGSGSMAGNVLLEQSVPSDSGFHALVKQTLSSIGEKSTGVRISFCKRKTSADVRYFYLNSDNTYKFINTASRPSAQEQTQRHAGLVQQGLTATWRYRMNDRTVVSAYGWYTQFDRNIAPTLLTITKVHQSDVSWRGSLQLEHAGERSSLQFKSAYLRDEYTYVQRSSLMNDSVILHEQGFSDNLIHQLTYERKQGKHLTWNAGANHTYQSVTNGQYAQGGRSRHRLSLSGGLKWESAGKRTAVTTQWREEAFGTQWSPLIYLLQLDQRLLRSLSLLAKTERHYRIPSMNDQYWGVGGNPDLKPEEGWAAELGLVHRLEGKKLRHVFNASAFIREVNNWILWVPKAEYTYWTAANISRVRSQGLEFKEDWSISFTPRLSVLLSAQHTIQRTVRLDHGTGEVYGKQLVYTPVYLGHAGITLQYGTLALSYSHQYTSWVFIQNDEGDFLDPYQVGLLRLQAGICFGKSRADAFVEMDNCWNATYQTVKDRPMPLRYFRAGLIYKWN